jgi:CheY-like chemotaxis protein
LLGVDDDPSMLRLYELEIAGWNLPLTLTTASNGMDALIQTGKYRPKLLITDLTMPEIDGFATIRRLRSNQDCAGMPVIVVSGLDQGALKAGGLPTAISCSKQPDLLRTAAIGAAARILKRPLISQRALALAYFPHSFRIPLRMSYREPGFPGLGRENGEETFTRAKACIDMQQDFHFFQFCIFTSASIPVTRVPRLPMSIHPGQQQQRNRFLRFVANLMLARVGSA